MLESLPASSLSLVTFNLGYLPGGDKGIYTRVDSTITALHAAERAVRPGGTVSVTAYPGHDEGAKEEAAVLEHASLLNQGIWSVHHHVWLNQRSKRNPAIRAPSLFLLQRMNAGRAPEA